MLITEVVIERVKKVGVVKIPGYDKNLLHQYQTIEKAARLPDMCCLIRSYRHLMLRPTVRHSSEQIGTLPATKRDQVPSVGWLR